MINRDEIEAGDKVYTRDGGCLVARGVASGNIVLGTEPLSVWSSVGFFYDDRSTHPLDIIRIEKAPKPVVSEIYFGWDDEDARSQYIIATFESVKTSQHVIKAVFVDGVWDKEKSEQVK